MNFLFFFVGVSLNFQNIKSFRLFTALWNGRPLLFVMPAWEAYIPFSQRFCSVSNHMDLLLSNV